MDPTQPAWTDGPTDLDGGTDLVLLEGRASFVPVALRKADPEVRAAVASVSHAVMSIHSMQALLQEAVSDARDAGASWASIGWAMGLTGEAVRLRFRDVM